MPVHDLAERTMPGNHRAMSRSHRIEPTVWSVLRNR